MTDLHSRTQLTRRTWPTSRSWTTAGCWQVRSRRAASPPVAGLAAAMADHVLTPVHWHRRCYGQHCRDPPRWTCSVVSVRW